MSEFEPFTTRNRARCGTCRNFRHKYGWCEVIKRDVKANMSCGLYVPGGPSENDVVPVRGEDMSTAAVAKRRADEARAKFNGAKKPPSKSKSTKVVATPVTAKPKRVQAVVIESKTIAVSGTCNDCRFFGEDDSCRLFIALNQVSRGLFLLDPTVDPGAWCNAHVARGDDGATLGVEVFGYALPVTDALGVMAKDADAFSNLVNGASTIDHSVPDVELIDHDDEDDFAQFVAAEANQ